MTWGEFKKLVDETEGMSDEEELWYIDVHFPDFTDVSILVNDNACGVAIS